MFIIRHIEDGSSQPILPGDITAESLRELIVGMMRYTSLLTSSDLAEIANEAEAEELRRVQGRSGAGYRFIDYRMAPMPPEIKEKPLVVESLPRCASLEPLSVYIDHVMKLISESELIPKSPCSYLNQVIGGGGLGESLSEAEPVPLVIDQTKKT